ncbi:MAG: alpha/beta hydrolase [Verrucomicrobiota bacterium]
MKSSPSLPSLLIALSLLLGTSCIGQNNRQAAPAPKTLPGAKTEIYKTVGDVELPLHIFTPEDHNSEEKVPAIVFFFGGGWNSGSPAQFQRQCEYLASRGMVAIAVEYRVARRHGVKVVSCVADAKSALRWTRQNASRLCIDPDRIAAGGGSAGGHLAAALATISKYDEASEDLSISSVPNALVLFNPAIVVAPVPGERELPEDRLAQLEKRFGVPPETLSPYHNIDKSLPPTVIFHGTEDKTVPYRTVEIFEEKAKPKGLQCKLFGYEGEGHGFFNLRTDRSEMFIATLTETDKFLTSLGYLKGKPKVKAFVASIE